MTVSQALSQQAGQTSNNSRGAFLSAGDGNNTIVGGNGNDNIMVGTGADLIICGPGATTVTGGVEASNVTANWSNQIGTTSVDGIPNQWTGNGYTEVPAPYNAPPGYVGGEVGTTPLGMGSDTIYGGKGNDYFCLPNGINYVDAGGGNDVIWGGAGTNTIYGGSGNDSILGGGGNDYINCESGSDIVVIDGGNSTVTAGTGNDTIYSGSYSNWATAITTNNSAISAGNGNTIVYGAGGNDTLNAGTGNDTLNAGSGNESLQGSAGNVQMQGGAGNDTLTAGDGNAYMAAGAGNTTITGGIGVETIYGGSGTNLISTGNGGVDGNPTLVYAGNGETTVNGGDGVDQIFGGAGDNVLNAGDGGDAGQATEVVAGTGSTTINGGAGIDNLFGGAGTDSIVAGDGGTSANPTSVTGGGGNDTIVAGLGYDNFYSGDGASNYQVNGGGGTVNIYSSQPDDTLTFGQNLTIGNITSVNETTYTNGIATTLTFGDGTTVTIYGDDLTEATFGDGTTVTLLEVLSSQFTAGNVTYSAVNGVLPNSVSPSFSHAGSPGGLNEIVAQTASPQPNTLTLYGSADLVGQGNNVNDVITANVGNDTLIAGTANDTLIGGGASDIYEVSAASGTVTTINSSAESDTLVFCAGISLSDLSVSTSVDANGDLDVTIQNSQGGQVVINGSLNSTVNGGDGSGTMLDQIAFADGTTASLSQLVAQLTAGPTAATSAANVTLAGGIQNMTLTAANISATGNGQDDALSAGAANDTLIAGSGNVTLNGAGYANTTFEFAPGSGNVTIVNASPTDVLSFAPGVTENQLTYSSVSLGNGDTMETFTDSQGGSVTFEIVNYGYGIQTLSFSDDSVVAAGQIESADSNYYNRNAPSEYSSVSVTATNGYTALYLTGNANLIGTANSGNMTIYSNAGNDTLVAGNGNDTLIGGGVSDTYDIAPGTQTTTIEQSSMFDMLVLGAGTTAANVSATESLVNGAYVIALQNSVGGTVDVVVGAGAPVDTIQFGNGSYASLGAILAQATTGVSAATSSISVTLPTNVQNMQLTGSANITATANALANVISANSGNDTLVAGVGNDTLVGSAGKTTYDFDAADGDLVIQNSGSGDTLVFDDSLAESDVTASSTVVGGQSVITLITDQGQTITIEGAMTQVSFADGNTTSLSGLLANSYTNNGTTYSNVSATAGNGITGLILTGDANIVGTANSLNDTLVSNSGNDTLVAGSGNDTLVGSVGSTTYSFSTGYGAATIENAGTADTIAFGAGVSESDISFSAAEASDGSLTLTIDNSQGKSVSIDDYAPGVADTVSFANGQSLSIQSLLAQSATGFAAATSAVNVSLPEGIQNMTLTGTWGLLAQANDEDNVITSNSGNDTLVAGQGNDTLVGGFGATTYVYETGDGNLTISNSGANDVLELGSGIAPTNLTVTATTVNGNVATTLQIAGGSTISVVGGALSNVQFADGSTMTLAELESSSYSVGSTLYSSVSVNPLPEADTILYLTGSANLTATGNDEGDLIAANAGNDTLIAGTGTDTLVGGSGTTTYEVTAANPATTTIEQSGANDQLIFGAESTLSNIVVSLSEDTSGDLDVTLQNSSTGDEVVIDGTGDTLLGSATFSDGITMTTAQLIAQATEGAAASTTSSSMAVPAGIQNEALEANNIVVAANNLDDVLSATNCANDSLVAGTGLDTLVGGGGDTTYEVSASDGATMIRNSLPGDALSFGAGITPADLSITASSPASGETFLTITDSAGSTVTILEGGSGYLSTIEFANGQTENLQALVAQITSGITAMTSASSVTLPNAIQNLTLTSSQNINATGNNLADIITANSGNDVLNAGTGNDTLVAGTGNDTMTGGTGVTTYEFNPQASDTASRTLTIDDGGNNDVLIFGAGITPSGLTISSATTNGTTVMTLRTGFKMKNPVVSMFASK